ncbi:MAG: MBL fold metallo-hydrolase [Lachnospiraceae bacterium]|nr:MBL fold metallo-hydrolase [Lachnospiraceae bacterium]
MKFCSIASGSSGNCTFVGTEDTRVLIDVGISKKRIEEGLLGIDESPLNIDYILITHEHIDHVKGLGVMSRKYHIPILATKETIQAILSMDSLGKLDEALFLPITPEVEFPLKNLSVKPVKISHDAANPVCYTISDKQHKVGIATDLGTYDERILRNLSDCEALLLEANHDVSMLEVGPYPYYLKQRILGERGHLSNDSSGQLLKQLLHPELKAVFLGHLSKENNYPDLAYQTVWNELQNAGSQIEAVPRIIVANRDCPSEPVVI